MKKHKLMSIFAITLAIFGMAYGCASSSFAAAQSPSSVQQQTSIAFGASTTLTWVYGFSVAMTEIINPLMPNITIYPQATAGSSAHYEMIDQGMIEMGTGSTFSDDQAQKGEGAFIKAYDSIRSMFPVNKAICQVVVRAGSDMKALPDLQGKRVAIGGRGSPTSVMSEAVLEALGITCNLSVSTHEEMVEMFKDGRVEAIIYFGGAPYSGILDIASGADIRLLPISAEEQVKISNFMPSLFTGVIPVDSYSFLTEDINTVGNMSNIIVHKDIADDIVYEIVKNAQENWENIAVTMPAARSVGLEDINGMVLPLHPGAFRYYEEKGINVVDKLKP